MEKKVNSKKRLLIIISILTACVILITVFSLYFIIEANKAPAQIEDTDENEMLETRLMEIPNGASPSDYSSEDVVAMLMWKLANTKEFKTVTTGTSKALFATQLINNTRIVKNDKALITTVSSGFVKLGKQKYIKDDKVLIRDATKIDGVNAIFDDNQAPECITSKSYIKQYGWMPFQVTGYIICEKTILNISSMTCEDGVYHIVMNLNPDGDYAPYWYKREILTSSGSSIVPEFFAIEIEYVFDNNFRILESNIKESYKVKSMGITANTNTYCHEVYEYDDINFDLDVINYFEKYLILNPKEENDD